MTREQETIEKISDVPLDYGCPLSEAQARDILSVIRAIVLEEVEKQEGVITNETHWYRPRTATEIKAALIERLGSGS